jgi:hypothetical protein
VGMSQGSNFMSRAYDAEKCARTFSLLKTSLLDLKLPRDIVSALNN